jgi:hypothetical protein
MLSFCGRGVPALFFTTGVVYLGPQPAAGPNSRLDVVKKTPRIRVEMVWFCPGCARSQERSGEWRVTVQAACVTPRAGIETSVEHRYSRLIIGSFSLYVTRTLEAMLFIGVVKPSQQKG